MESQDPEILVSIIDIFTNLKNVDEQLFCVVRNAVQVVVATIICTSLILLMDDILWGQGSRAEVIEKCAQLVQFIFQESSRNNNKEAIKYDSVPHE